MISDSHWTVQTTYTRPNMYRLYQFKSIAWPARTECVRPFWKKSLPAEMKKWLKLLINIEKHLWRHALRNRLITIITVVIIKQMSVMQFAKYLCRVRDSKHKYCFDIIEIKL